MALVNVSSRSSVFLRVALVAAVVIVLVARFLFLDADPPADLSNSTDVFTDSGQYTYFARNFVKFGEFNPFNDYRFPFFLKSSVTLLSVVIFKLLGVGWWQSNLVGVLFATGALLLFGLFIKRVAGIVPQILYLVFAGLDYALIFFGRQPFLEHAMAFFAFLGLVLVSGKVSWWRFLLGGASLAVSIFFAKVLSAVFLFPFGCFLLYRWVHDSERFPKINVRLILFFILGFMLVMLGWFLYSYMPMKSQVAGYLTEQTFSLYGAPEAFNSVDDFAYKFISFGWFSKLFPRMPVAGLLAAVFCGMILFHVARPKSWKEGFGRWNAGHVFVAALIIAYIGALMIWNYRPLRYQLVLIYPLYGGAAFILHRIASPWSPTESERTPVLFYPFCFLLLGIPLFQLLYGLGKLIGYEVFYTEERLRLAVASAIVTGLVGWLIHLYRKGKIRYSETAAMALAAMLGTWIGGVSLFRFIEWTPRATYVFRDTSRDIGRVLAPEAILSGPYAPNLVLNNDLRAIIHMFGVSQADPKLFERYPITHIINDDANEERAKQDYPEIMEKASHVVSYVVGITKIRVSRVAGATGNRQADASPYSLYEEVYNAYRQDDVPRAKGYALKFLERYPDNIAGYQILGDIAENMGLYSEAETLLKKAVEFSPTSYLLKARLGKFYRDRFAATEDDRFRELGLEQYRAAVYLAPTVDMLRNNLEKLRTSEPWQLKSDTAS